MEIRPASHIKVTKENTMLPTFNRGALENRSQTHLTRPRGVRGEVGPPESQVEQRKMHIYVCS